MDCLLISLVFDILRYTFSSVLWGVLFTLLSVGAFFFIIKSCYPKRAFTSLSFIVGAILSIFLFFQFVFICSAFKVRGMVDDMETSISQYMKASDNAVTTGKSQRITEQLIDDYPLLGCYVKSLDFQGDTTENIASGIISEIKHFLNMYTLRRVGWILFYCALGSFVVIKTMEVYSTTTTSRGRTAMRSTMRSRGLR